jgi:hypothetical protein
MTIEAATVDPHIERLRYDGFRAFLLGRTPTERLADAFARQVVTRGEQGRYGYPANTVARLIAQDMYYWVIRS